MRVRPFSAKDQALYGNFVDFRHWIKPSSGVAVPVFQRGKNGQAATAAFFNMLATFGPSVQFFYLFPSLQAMAARGIDISGP